MRFAASFFVALAAALSLSGCGQSLGKYTVISVSLTADAPLKKNTLSSYGEFIEVRLTSETNIASFEKGVDAIYVDADFCPLNDRLGLIAFGLFSDEGADLRHTSLSKGLERGLDGQFHYRVFIPVAHEARVVTKPGQIQLPTYDLRQSDQSICLRLFAPSYNVTETRSKTIRVPAELVSAALR